MEQRVYKDVKSIDRPEDLKEKAQEVWDELSQRLINRAIDQWRSRLQKLVEQEGGHIEQYF